MTASPSARATQQYATTTSNLTARIALHAYGTNAQDWFLDDPEAALRELARVLRPGGRLAVAVNGRDHLAELLAIGPRIGRPDLTLSAAHHDVTAETVPGLVARHFTEVAAARYPCDLEVPSADPILAFLASLTGEPLTPRQLSEARDLIQARIDTHGTYHIRKNTVLITAKR